jgi:hypothetical protein
LFKVLGVGHMLTARIYSIVMTGLGPVIHEFESASRFVAGKLVDAPS